MNKITIITLAITTLLFTQCEVYREGCMDPNATNYDVAADIDDGSCEYTIDPNKVDCYSNLEGNLSVTNETDDVLLLYASYDGVSEYISCIPANTEEFILYVQNQQSQVYTLQVWKATNIENQNSPNLDQVYRQWSVALSSSTTPSERANWIITDNDENRSSGTLSLSYPSLDEYNQEVIYQVDIFLNSKTGTRLASMQPGISNKQVSVDYGIHYLYFRYWYSDPNSSSGEITEIGWDEISDIVINAEHKSSNIEIPVLQSIVGKYGYVKVNNTTNSAISIYANDQLIEKIAKVDGSSDGLSIIPSNNSTTFLIPEGTFTISARTTDGATSIATFKSINNSTSETTEIVVGVKHKEILISNKTSERLLLFNEEGTYLGKTIEAGGSSGSFLVNSSYDSVLVITPNKTQKKKVAAEIGVTVNDLEAFVTQNLSINQSWTVISDGYYQSPDISDSESTSMTATLINTESVLLSFEYRVSSEYDYDKFSFKIDDVVKIDGESGTTEWKNFSINVAPGTHTLEWLYTKDEMFDVGNDNVEIRGISIN